MKGLILGAFIVAIFTCALALAGERTGDPVFLGDIVVQDGEVLADMRPKDDPDGCPGPVVIERAGEGWLGPLAFMFALAAGVVIGMASRITPKEGKQNER